MVEDHLRRDQGPMGTGRHMRIRQNQRGAGIEISVQGRSTVWRHKASEAKLKRIETIKIVYDLLQSCPPLVNPSPEEPLAFLTNKIGWGRFPWNPEKPLAWNDPDLLLSFFQMPGIKTVRCSGAKCIKTLPVIMHMSIGPDGRWIKIWSTYCPNCSHICRVHGPMIGGISVAPEQRK